MEEGLQEIDLAAIHAAEQREAKDQAMRLERARGCLEWLQARERLDAAIQALVDAQRYEALAELARLAEACA